MKKRVITIGRQFGSNGRVIGELLAKRMGYSFYDKEIINNAAKESGICKEILDNLDERPTSSFIYSLVMDPYSFGFLNGGVNNVPLNQQAFKATYDTIIKVADYQPCVIVGRCADYVLRKREDVINIFIYAPMTKRIETISERLGLKEDKARDKIVKEDKARASYYNYYTSKKWASMDSYDMCINSSLMSVEDTVEFLYNYINGIS